MESPPPAVYPFSYREDDDWHHWMPIVFTTLFLVAAVVMWVNKIMKIPKPVATLPGNAPPINPSCISTRDAQMGAILAVSIFLIAAHTIFAAKGFNAVTVACVAVAMLLFDFLTQETYKVNFKELNLANVVMIATIYGFVTGYSDMLRKASDKGGFGDIMPMGGFPFGHFISATLFAFAFVYRTCCARAKIYPGLMDVGLGEIAVFVIFALYALLQYLSVAMTPSVGVDKFRRDAISVMYVAFLAAFCNAIYHLTMKPKNFTRVFNVFWTVMFFLAIVFTHLHIRNEYSTLSREGFDTAAGFEKDVSNAEKEDDDDNKGNLKILLLFFWSLVVAIPFLTLYNAGPGVADSGTPDEAEKPAAMWKHM